MSCCLNYLNILQLIIFYALFNLLILVLTIFSSIIYETLVILTCDQYLHVVLILSVNNIFHHLLIKSFLFVSLTMMKAHNKSNCFFLMVWHFVNLLICNWFHYIKLAEVPDVGRDNLILHTWHIEKRWSYGLL